MTKHNKEARKYTYPASQELKDWIGINVTESKERHLSAKGELKFTHNGKVFMAVDGDKIIKTLFDNVTEFTNG